MAFVSTTPVVLRASTFTAHVSHRRPRVAPAAVRMSVPTVDRKRAPKKAAPAPAPVEKVPQGFTMFSEKLNGRFAMMGFFLGLVTEVITGKGMLAQVASVGEILNLASKLAN